jgi:YD repeat-containing protein
MKTKILLIILAVNVLSVYTQNTIESGTLRAASNSYVPNSVEIDKYNKEVGEIPFTSAVTQTGAMTYTIPIEIYPGIKDMHPQLALSYNHLSGNGLLGVGWNLSGLSSISRTSNNLYYNNLVQPVNLTTSDAFVLDGMRLIKVDESTNQIKYESEQGNIKVTAFLNGNIVKYFEVYYPTGRKGVYGYTSNAANKLQYPLTSLTDLYGNLITYAYTEQSNHYLLTNIIYYNRQIDFQYESRPDNISFYSAGLNMLENKRLKNIICRYSSSILRTYSLTYETQKNSSVLTQIDCSASGRFLNPLKFYYGTNNNATNYLTSSTSLPSPYYRDTKSENMIVKVGKFDRSEDVDALIVYPRKSPYVLLPAPITGQANQKYRNGYDDISTEKIFLYTGMNTSPATSNPALTIGEGFIDMLSADVDGQYGDEVIKINDIISGSAYSLQQLSGTYTGLKKSDWGENRQLLLGELNGDGKPDFLLSPPYTNSSDHSWKVFYSKGNGDFNTTFFQSANNEVNNDYATQFMLQDVNGDGLTDLIKYFSNNIYTYLVKDDNKPSLNYENVVTVTSNSILAPVDINNYNYFGKLLSLKDGTVTKYGFPRNDTQEKLLTGIVSSLGIVQKIFYQTLDDRYTKLTENEQYIYTQGSTSGINYPNVIFNGHIFVPGLVEQYFKGQKNESLSYTYTGGVVHKQGLGFRGFRKVTTYDNIRRREAVQEYEPLRFGIMASENTPVSTNTYYTSVDIGTDKRVKIRPSGLDQYDKLTGVTVSTSFNSYDSYGNPTSIYVDYGDGVREETSFMYYNNANESAYLLGFLRDKIKTTIRNGITYQEQVYISSHDNKGSPIERKNYINNNQVSLETFGYDYRGFCTQKSVKSYTSANTLTTWFEYNSYGQLAKETNPLNMVTTYIYNDLGRLSAAKDHRDRQTNYGYNNFGRLWTVSYPDGTSETSSYTWDIPETNGLYCVTTSATGKPTGKTYYDALGRETRSSVVQFNGTESHTQKQYDTYGRLQKMSLPFTGSSASFWNTYNYCSDNSDRLQSIVEASGRRTSYSYSETNVTETKDGMETTRKYDNSGHLKEVNDPGGTVTYNLRPDGQPSSVVAPGNIITSFEYDNYARK